MNSTHLKTRPRKTRCRARKWILVGAARPNFMKIAPLIRAIEDYNARHAAADKLIVPLLVHTGQHYDDNMSDAFFRDLQIPAPDIHMGIGSGSHAEQTGQVMMAFEKILVSEKPDLVVVVGDVNSTMACAVAAVKLHIPVAHVEAGLRSFDRTMPEEINRLITDAVADYLFTPSPDGDKNLLREGCSPDKIFPVGNIMADTLLFNLEQAKKRDTLHRLGLSQSTENGCPPYALLTLHRPANVDNRETFSRILDGLCQIASRIPIIFPLHPRTRKQIIAFGFADQFIFCDQSAPAPPSFDDPPGGRIYCPEPLGYLDFLSLMTDAKFVLTDSGGIQEETTVLDVPCITIRDTTERPITVMEGTNILVGDNPDKMYLEAQKVLDGQARHGRCPELWDGKTAERIVKILAKHVLSNADAILSQSGCDAHHHIDDGD
ncbi:MAG: UDP-N-acetylglucosamine 2-epimerase (non-hydrolyzing) [Deltaproteobacteria bacterium]|nr:UDP-N-acetylglucosamine 2-epimerase (non-hydrolyzing) [Deltaproteobacteria bacterium]